MKPLSISKPMTALAALTLAAASQFCQAQENQALFGTLSKQDGRQILKLRQPLTLKETTIREITLQGDPVPAGENQELQKNNPFAGQSIAYGRIDVSDPANPVMQALRISVYGTSAELVPPTPTRRTQMPPNSTLILSQQRNTNIQVKQTNISIQTPAVEDNPGKLTEMEKKMVGRWSMNNSGAEASVGVGPVSLGGSFSQQMAIDLSNDRKGSFTISAKNPLGDSLRLNMLGIWQIVRHKGKDALLMRFTKFTGDWPKGMKTQDSELLYIEYVGANTLILAGEAGARYEFAK